MGVKSVTGWQEQIAAGRKYLKTARNGRFRPKVFNNELVFQMAAMAIERLMVGVCHYHNRLPEGHTLSGLVQDLRLVCAVDDDLVRRIEGIERTDDMCSLSAASRPEPDPAAVEEILQVGTRVEELAKAQVPWDNQVEG